MRESDRNHFQFDVARSNSTITPGDSYDGGAKVVKLAPIFVGKQKKNNRYGNSQIHTVNEEIDEKLDGFKDSISKLKEQE